MANDVQVKRYYWSQTTDTVAYTDVTITSVDTTKAFARPLGQTYGGTNSGVTNYVKDFVAVPIITSATNCRVYHSPNATANREGYIEVWEYTGPTGGSSEFKVLHQAYETFTATSTSLGVTLSNTATTLADCVAIGVGVTADGFADTEVGRGDELAVRLEVTATDTVTMTRYDGTGAVEVGVVVLEFNGSDWTVQKLNSSHPTSTTGAATHTLGTTLSDWSKTMHFSTWEVNDAGTGQDDITLMIYKGNATTSQIKSYFEVSTTTPPDFTVYLVEHASLSVEHNDTVDGTANDVTSGGFKPTTTITAPTDHDLSTAIGFSLASNGTGTQHAANQWNVYLSATTTLATEYGSSNQDEDVNFGFQIIDLDSIAGSAGGSVAPLAMHYRRLQKVS